MAPDPEGERLLAVMREAAGEALDLSTSSPAMRADLSRRLAALRVGDAVAARMGALCATPRKAWPWAKALGSGTVPDPVSVAWLLGGRRDDGARTGRPLRDLAWKAEADVRAQRAAEEARRQAHAEREAERARRASQPPMTPAMLREIRERMSLRAPSVAA